MKPQLSFAKTGISFLEYRYLPYLLSGIYFFIMLYVSFNYHTVGDYGLETDFYMRYVPNAEAFLNGTVVIDGFQGPLYPMVLGVFKSIIGDYMKAGQLINCLGISCFLLSITLVFRRIFTIEVALAAFLITATNKHIIQNTYSCGTDMLFLGLLGAMIFFLLRSQTFNWKNICLTGLFAGLAFLTRFNGLFMLIGIILSYSIINIYQVNLKTRLILSLAVTTIFLAIYAPYGFYTLSEKDSFLYNTNYKNVAWTYQAEGKVTWDQFWHEDWCAENNIHGTGDVIFYDFGAFVTKYTSTLFTNIEEDFNQLINWLIGILSFIGLLSYIIYFPSKGDRRELSFVILSLIFWGVLGLVFYNPRFSMFLIPFYVAMALRIFILQKVNSKVPFLKYTPLILGAILFFTSLSKAKKYNKELIDSGPKEMIKIQRWFDRNQPKPDPEDGIFARKPHVAYFTGLKFQMFPVVKSWDDFLNQIKEKNVKYIYYSYFEYSNRPQLRILTEPNKVPPQLKLIHIQAIPGNSKQVPGFLYKVEIED